MHKRRFELLDTQKASLRVRVSLARFNASKRVRGASVGAPTAGGAGVVMRTSVRVFTGEERAERQQGAYVMCGSAAAVWGL